MGAKTGKPPLLKKVKFFAQKIRLTLDKNICIQKDYFRETKKFGGGSDSPPKNSKNTFFRTTTRKNALSRKKIFSGWELPFTPKFGDPRNFRLFVDIWTLCENFVEIGCRKVELHVSELPHCSFIIKAAMGLSLCTQSCRKENVNFRDFETYAKNDWQQLGK